MSVIRLLATVNDEGTIIIKMSPGPRMADVADQLIRQRDGRLMGP